MDETDAGCIGSTAIFSLRSFALTPGKGPLVFAFPPEFTDGFLPLPHFGFPDLTDVSLFLIRKKGARVRLMVFDTPAQPPF